jgi:HAD superfamily hydrolase (TIGR01509 family)
MTRISHAIFDCDGVLIDSEAISMAIDVGLLAESGVDIGVEEAHRRFVGLTFEAMIEEIENEYRLKLPADLIDIKDRRMLEAYRRELKPVAGVRAALAAIALPKSVGTNGPRARAIEALKITGLWDFFDGITTFEDVANGKPSPDIYLKAAERAGAEPGACIVIEDSVAGVSAGAEAGCLVIGFTGTAHDPAGQAQRLKSRGARHILESMDDLPAMLEGFGSLAHYA